MNNFIKINSKKLNILLLTISAFFYYKTYWGIYSLIVFDVLDIKLELISVLDMIFIGVFALSVVPCSYGIKYLIQKFLMK